MNQDPNLRYKLFPKRFVMLQTYLDEILSSQERSLNNSDDDNKDFLLEFFEEHNIQAFKIYRRYVIMAAITHKITLQIYRSLDRPFHREWIQALIFLILFIYLYRYPFPTFYAEHNANFLEWENNLNCAGISGVVEIVRDISPVYQRHVQFALQSYSDDTAHVTPIIIDRAEDIWVEIEGTSTMDHGEKVTVKDINGNLRKIENILQRVPYLDNAINTTDALVAYDPHYTSYVVTNTAWDELNPPKESIIKTFK